MSRLNLKDLDNIRLLVIQSEFMSLVFFAYSPASSRLQYRSGELVFSKHLIKYSFSPNRVFNCDETEVLVVCENSKVLSVKVKNK